MKKLLSLLAASLLSVVLWAQGTPTIVSTQPQNRNAVIEELTGQNCTWCPAGHKIVNELIEANNGRVIGINVHAGPFASGSPYVTTYGTSYNSQANPSGYPAGTVNRHVFSGTSTVLARSQFASASNTIMNMASPVNVAAVAHVDADTRQVELHIEAYYTGNSSVATNYLNVAVLQSNVMGQQTGGQTNYPEMMENGLYRHNHMLRDMLTGTWGVAIPATQGTFIDTTINYTIPASIGSVAIDDVNDIDFVVFIAEGHQEILTGVKASIISDKPSLANFKVDRVGDCGLDYQPYITIANNTETTFNSFTINYDGTNLTRSKTIASLQTDTINLPVHTVAVNGQPTQQCTTTKTVSLVSAVASDGTATTINSASKSVIFADFNIYTAEGPFQLKVGIDAYGSEASVKLLKQDNCSEVWGAGPWTDLSINWNNIQYISQIPDARHYIYNIDVAEPGLYIIRTLDSYGDGWTSTNDSKTSGIWLSNADGSIINYGMGYSNGDAFTSLDLYLNVTNSGSGSFVGIDDVQSAVDFSLYPNPANDRLNISGVEGQAEVSVLDVTGRTLMTGTTTRSLDISALVPGVYVVRVASEQGVGVRKFVKE